MFITPFQTDPNKKAIDNIVIWSVKVKVTNLSTKKIKPSPNPLTIWEQ